MRSPRRCSKATIAEVGPLGFASQILRHERLLLVAIAGLGLALRLYGIRDAWLNPDEGIYYSMTVWRDSAQFWEEVAGNAHPPLYYMLLRGIASWTPDFTVLRLLSVVSGVLAIVGVHALARALFVGGTPAHDDGAHASQVGDESSARTRAVAAALVAALFVALAPGQVTISQIMRPYAFLIATLSFGLAGLVLWARGGSWSALVLHVTCTSLALVTHYSAFLVAPTMVFVVLHAVLAGRLRGQRLIATFAAACVSLVIVVALYFWHLRPRLLGSALEAQAFDGEGWLAPFLIDSPLDLLTHTKGFVSFHVGHAMEFAAFALVLTGIVVSCLRRDVRTLLVLGTLWGTAILFAALGKYPFGASRHSLWMTPMIAIAFGRGTTSLLARRPAVSALVAAVLIGCVFVGERLAVLTNFGAPLREIVGEQPVPRSSIARFASLQSEIERENGFVLTDMQSYYTLLPLYERSREAASIGANTEWLRFQWGRREVDVAWRWQLSPLAQDYGQPQHIAYLVDARDAAVPEGPRLRDAQDAILLWAGWPAVGPLALAQANEALPEERRFLVSAFQVPGITAYHVRLDALLSAMHR
ncbi:MAG: hypothetical protein H6832_08250 [Planctomycetes bacterium]|nr:hypothetical protein [Planctomycetota bacterium]MCB9918379.1 hypothetical protein [Planctomycetota bacterium]